MLAALDAIGQLLFLPSYPVWSIIIIAVDVFIIYALAVYGTVSMSNRALREVRQRRTFGRPGLRHAHFRPTDP